jgi:TolA-binding protein
MLVKQLKVSMPVEASVATKKMDNITIEKEAKKLFDNQKYSEAQAYYEIMVQKKYKQSEATFWIGECYFEQNKYKEAVGYYKQSASLNEKSSVMPTLLLHTGISMEKTGDKEKAKSFYNATISRYGSTGSAVEAKEKLAKLK